MLHKKLTIRSDEGLQERATALLAQTSGKFSSTITIEQGNKRVNAKSVMGVLSLRLRKGDSFILAVAGADEEQALAAVSKLIENGEV